MIARRVLQLAVAAVAIMAVAFVARPSEPHVPEPFSVDQARPSGAPQREAPSRAPSPVPEPGAEPAEEPVAESGAAGGSEVRDLRVAVHTLDPRTLEPLAEPLGVPLGPDGPLESALSPDGRHLALYHEPSAHAHVRPGTLRLYDTDHLDRPPEVIEGVPPTMATGLQFSQDSSHLVWFDHGSRVSVRLGVLRLGGEAGGVEVVEAVELPADLVVTDFLALDGGRVGVQGHTALDEAGEPADHRRREPDTGPMRLLVADLGTGAVEVDLSVPAPGGGAGPGRTDHFRYLRAAVAWDGARDRAYVAHADRDAVLVADLATGEVTAELAADPPSPSGGDADEARWREATLSDDGRILHVHGTAVAAGGTGAEDADDQREHALPVLVADLEAGTVVRTDTRGRLLATSPAGEHVVLTSQGHPGDEPPAVRLHAGGSLARRWERSVGHPIEAAFLPDGLLQVFSVEQDAAGTQPRGRLDLLDVEDGSRLRTVRFEGQWLHPHLPAPALVEVLREGGDR